MRQQRASIAKITAPRLFGVVPRERLFAALDAHRGRPLVWVEGPPGAGKTTFVASYLDCRKGPAMWFQIDAGDVDPANLVHYLTLAAEPHRIAPASPLPRLAPEHLSDLAAFSRRFARALFEQLPAGVVLVFDNYQDVPAEAPMHEMMRALVEEVPREDRVICVSRVGPPAPFTRLVANGGVAFVNWDDLKLTVEETRSMAAAQGIGDDWLVKALHEQSGGWAAGIRLMTERVRQVDGNGTVLPTGSLESVFNYFAALLFDRAAPQVRHALLSVAFLRHVSPAAAAALSGDPAAGEVFAALHRRHLFTDRRPGPEPVYELHALFRAFLENRNVAELPAGALHDLRLRSAEASLRDSDTDTAFRLFAEAGEWQSAAHLFLHSAPDLLANGRRATIELRSAALPDWVRDRHPRVWYWIGRVETQVRPLEAVSTLEAAVDLMRAQGDTEGVMLGLAALLSVGNLGHLALDRAREWATAFLAICDAQSAEVLARLDPAVWGAFANVMFARPGHPRLGEMALHVATALERGRASPGLLGAAAGAISGATCAGQFPVGERIAAAMVPAVDSPHASPSEAAWFLYAVGYLRFLQTRYEDAHALMVRAERVASAAGLRETLYEISLYRFMIEFRVMGWDVARRTLREAENVPVVQRPMRVALLRIYQARRATWQGDDAEAADLAEASMAAIEAVGTDYHLMCFGLFNAEVLIADGRCQRAAQWIARSRAIIEDAPSLDGWNGPLLLTEAFLAWRLSGHDMAVMRLRTALAESRRGTRRYFLRYQECSMPPLFCLALEEDIETDLVLELIRKFRLVPPVGAPDAWPRPLRIVTLGRFEVVVNGEVLEYSRKVPRKTLALLKALIAHGSREVPEDWLCDRLWPDDEADAARQALGITVLRLRKLLACAEAVGQQGGKVWLDRQRVWVDAWRFDRLLSGDEAVSAGTALALYGGLFLPDDEGQPWSVTLRERLRGKFVHALVTRGAQLETEGNCEAAASLYLRGLDADAIVEGFHQGLMRCYLRLGRATEAVSAFRRLRKTLSVVLGVAPSPASRALFDAAMSLLPPSLGAGEDNVMPTSGKDRLARRERSASARGAAFRRR